MFLHVGLCVYLHVSFVCIICALRAPQQLIFMTSLVGALKKHYHVVSVRTLDPLWPTLSVLCISGTCVSVLTLADSPVLNMAAPFEEISQPTKIA